MKVLIVEDEVKTGDYLRQANSPPVRNATLSSPARIREGGAMRR